MSPTQPAEPKPIVTRNSSEFNRDAYASIPSGELVVFAVQVLQADGSSALTEDIVSICFRFFPHSFALKNYFYWPDSALVTRRLHDAKEKGLLKGNAADGFEVKVQGRQAAKHVAKALGVVFPAPPKVEIPPAPVAVEKPKVEEAVIEKKEEKKAGPVVAVITAKAAKPGPKKPVNKKEAKKPAKPKKKTPKTTAPIKKKAAFKPKVQPKPAPKKKVSPVVKTKVVKKPAAKVIKEEKRKKIVNKPAPKPKTEKKDEKKKTAQGAKTMQLAMPLTPPTAWKNAEVRPTKPKVKEEAQQARRVEAAPAVVSKEEKDKAAKVVKQIERSDAYRSYRRNGKRATIGEFDFRNMLFATMESSAETLKRNTDLFKRYAGIHFRADLVAFLEFCEEKFSALLVTKAKGKR